LVSCWDSEISSGTGRTRSSVPRHKESPGRYGSIVRHGCLPWPVAGQDQEVEARHAGREESGSDGSGAVKIGKPLHACLRTSAQDEVLLSRCSELHGGTGNGAGVPRLG
jgi:hypothetical protein